MMLGCAASEHHMLNSYEIIFDNSNLCDHDTSTSWTNCRSNTVLCVASCSKNSCIDEYFTKSAYAAIASDLLYCVILR